jgi:ERCC4-type nuclease
MNLNDFTIIVDTREQKPWDLDHRSIASRKLDTGDYSVEGLENIFAIERKQSVSEIANNITEKRFVDVLERLQKIPHRFILLEFTLNNVLDYPIGSTVPKKLWSSIRITGKYILKYLTEINIKYGIHTIYCGNRENAEIVALSIMRRMVELYGNGKQL